MIGIDPSAKMIEAAKQKSNAIDWRIGSAEKIYLNDESIDGAIAVLTIHHWSDLTKGFKELNRILKDDGRIIIFTSSAEQMKSYWLTHYFPKMMKDSIKQMPSIETVKNIIAETGFQITQIEKYFVKDDLEDLFLYSGKQNPELYLKPEVRNGISSFSSLANIDEIKNGIGKLKEDITSGKIKEVINSFENNLGDYLFIAAEKVS